LDHLNLCHWSRLGKVAQTESHVNRNKYGATGTTQGIAHIKRKLNST